MLPVKVSELKNRLSHYLREVRRGESVLVSDRDRVIARIDPVGGATAADGGDASWIDDLERRGTIRRPRHRLDADWLKRRPRVTGDVVAALLEERDDGR
jgi:antitoxin (DNA-binding transcriptional repressor) of toxin-antitoxin stability system